MISGLRARVQLAVHLFVMRLTGSPRRGKESSPQFTGALSRVFLCSPMILRRVAGALFILLAVQYAALGVAPLCADALHGGGRIVQGPAHGEHQTGSPCAPTPQDSGSHHSTPSCLAMTGCMATGIAAITAPQLVDPRVRVEHVSRAPAPLASIFSTPETPPPIVV